MPPAHWPAGGRALRARAVSLPSAFSPQMQVGGEKGRVFEADGRFAPACRLSPSRPPAGERGVKGEEKGIAHL